MPPKTPRKKTPFLNKKITYLAGGFISVVLLTLAICCSLNVFSGEVNVLWVEGEHSQRLQELVQDFTKKTNIPVNISAVPKKDFKTYFFNTSRNNSNEFDVVMADPLWIGEAVMYDYIQELDPLLSDKLEKKFFNATLKNYAEYPRESSRYWGVPFHGNAIITQYNSSLLEDSRYQKEFEEMFGYKLDKPKTLQQFNDIANFFHRPEDGFCGSVMLNNDDKYSLSWQFLKSLFSSGGDIGNPSYEVDGIINSDMARNVLVSQRNIWSNSCNSEISYQNLQSPFRLVFSDDIDPDPAWKPVILPINEVGRDINIARGYSGMLIKLAKNQDNAVRFLKWLAEDSTQAKWAQMGGRPTNKNVLFTSSFQDINPINSVYSASIQQCKSFWKTPNNQVLLKILEKYLADDTKDSLEEIQKEWSDVLRNKDAWKMKLMTNEPENKRDKILYLSWGSVDAFWDTIGRKMRQEGIKRDIEITEIVLEEEDTSDLLNKELVKGVNGIIFPGVGTEGSATEDLIEAQKQGIPIVLFDSADGIPGIITAILSDNYAGGRAQGEFISQKIKPDEKVLVLSGRISQPHALARRDGALDILNAKGIETTSINTDWSPDVAAEILVDLLNSSKFDFSAIICPSDSIALISLEFLEKNNLGNDILIVGYDGLGDVVQKVSQGKIAATYQQPFNEFANASIEAILKHRIGRPIPEKIILSGNMITEDNVHLFTE